MIPRLPKKGGSSRSRSHAWRDPRHAGWKDRSKPGSLARELEPLAEGAPKGVVKLRIVDKLSTEQNGYNEIVLEDEELIIQVSFVRQQPKKRKV